MEQQLIQQTYLETSKALNDIYKNKKRTLFFQKIMWAITGIFFIALLFNLAINSFPFLRPDFLKPFSVTADNPYATSFPIIGLIVLLYPASYFFINAFQKFKVEEAKAIAQMIKTLFPQAAFSQNVAAPQREVKKSKLFAWVKADTPIYSYGQMRSTAQEQLVNIADIGIIEQDISNQFLGGIMRIPGLNVLAIFYQYILKNLWTNKSADNVYYTYRGMFCWLKFKKALQGHTLVLTNNQSSKLNRFFSSHFSEEERIHLEDPRFTDQFIVYSTDQVESRYVLSTALMERIVALKQKFKQPILLSFQHEQMYLAVQNEHGLFSFPAERLDAIAIVEELANDIDTALRIAAELNLR